MNTMEASMKQRAVRCWELMTRPEKTCVRMGLIPLWATQEDLGGKTEGAPQSKHLSAEADRLWEKIEGQGPARAFSLAMFEMAELTGGMIA